MVVNKCFLIGLHLLATYHTVKTSVIISANVDDVKNVAKEFSGPLTDKIVSLILKAAKNYTLNSSNEEARSFKSNLNLPLKFKYKNTLRNKKEPIKPVNYYYGDIKVKETTKHSYYISPKINNYAEVKAEAQRIYSNPKSYNAISLTNHIPPPQVMKKIAVETLEPKETHDDNLKQAPKISSQVLNEPEKHQIGAANVKNISSKVSDEFKLIYKNTSKTFKKSKIDVDGDLNNIYIQKEITKKMDTSTKLIVSDTDFHNTKVSSKRRKKKSKTMQTKEVINLETTANTSLETEVTIKTKTERYIAVPVTTPTTTHNNDTTVDLELQKFKKEADSYLRIKSSQSTTSEATSQQMTKNTHSRHRNDNYKYSKSKRHKKHSGKQDLTKRPTLNLMRLVEKVEQLDQVAQKLMSSTTAATPITTAKTFSSTRPTPAYPKQEEEYRIPDSEFQLSYNPNQKLEFRDYNLMYAHKRNQMFKGPEDNVQRATTVGKLSEIIQKIIETRLDNKFSETKVTEQSSRRQYQSSRPTEVRSMRGLLTNSEEEAMFKIIKAMIDSKKANELKSPSYVEEKKRSTVKAFNIKMSPEENMAEVIREMVDSSLRMQFERPQMSVSALADTLKNKNYENHIASGNKKVSEMIEKLIEEKIQKYAQTNSETAHSKQYQDETQPEHNRKDKTWPSVRPTYKNIERAQTAPKNMPPATRYQTQTRTTVIEEAPNLPRTEFQIPYAEYPRTTLTRLADKTFSEERSIKWNQNKYTTPLPDQGSAIKISRSRQGPISIVIEDKESDEINRPMPPAFLLQESQTTDRIDPQIIVVDNRHKDLSSTKGSFWENQLKTELIQKILRQREITKNIDMTTTIRYKDNRLGDHKQSSDGGLDSNRIPNLQLVFLNVPQLDTKENQKQILREKQESKDERKNEKERREEEKRKDEKQRRDQEKRKEEERRREEERIKKREEEIKRERQEEIIREEKRREEKEKEEKRIEHEMRLEKEKRKEEERRLEEKIIEERRLEEERKIEELKRKEEEIRKEVERRENEKKALRQKIEKEIKVKEILDRKWENDLENKIKQKQTTIALLQEGDKKKKDEEKKIFFMPEKMKNELQLAFELKSEKEMQTTLTQYLIQSTPSTTLNYWERQWQQDQETKLREEYNKYMKLHNAGRELNEKTINYWNELWRVDLEKKLREKQNERYEPTKARNNNKWSNIEISTSYYNMEEVETEREPALMEMVGKAGHPITDAFGDILEVQKNLQTEPNNPVHYDWIPRVKIKQKHKGSERSMLENIVIRPFAKSNTNRFDARRDDNYSGFIYIMPDGRKRDKLMIKRVHGRSNRPTAIEHISEEHTHDDTVDSGINKRAKKNHKRNKYTDDVIKSDTIIKGEKIDWRKPERIKSKKVTAFRVKTDEQTEIYADTEKSSEIIESEYEMKLENDKTESGATMESSKNLLRTKKDEKQKSKHTNDNNKLTGEENKNSKIRTKTSKKKKANKKNEHETIKKTENGMKKGKKVKTKNDSRDPEKLGNLSKENEKFIIYNKKIGKRERKVKHNRKVKTEIEEGEETEYKKHKPKQKPKNKKTKKSVDNKEGLDRGQRKTKEKEMLNTKQRRKKKGKSKDIKDESNKKHEGQLKEKRKVKHKKKEKYASKIEKIKSKKKKHRKGENNKETREYESKIGKKVSAQGKEDKRTNKKSEKSDKGEPHQSEDESEKEKKVSGHEKGDKKKNEISDKGESHQKKEIVKKRNDEDDGGRKFDFQLMIGEK